VEKIVLYSDMNDMSGIASAFPGYAVKKVSSVKPLVEAIVSEPVTAALCVWTTREDDVLTRLLTSIRQTFPRLNIFVFTALPEPKARVEGCRYYPEPPSESAGREIREHLSAADGAEQRRHNRFGWPLKAALKNENGEWELYRLHSLSAGGAFFAHPRQIPKAGSVRDTIIQFQNCRFRVRAEVLDTRRNSSNLPFGFGVKFIDLDNASSALIDRIVNNALVKHLLEPGKEQNIPSIGEEELTVRFDLT
jgi:hypothetical protein